MSGRVVAKPGEFCRKLIPTPGGHQQRCGLMLVPGFPCRNGAHITKSKPATGLPRNVVAALRGSAYLVEGARRCGESHGLDPCSEPCRLCGWNKPGEPPPAPKGWRRRR